MVEATNANGLLLNDDLLMLSNILRKDTNPVELDLAKIVWSKTFVSLMSSGAGGRRLASHAAPYVLFIGSQGSCKNIACIL